MTERRELKERRWVIEGLWVGFALPRDLDPARYKELIWASRHHRSSGAARGFRSRGSANPTSEPVITAPLFQFTAFSAVPAFSAFLSEARTLPANL
jgi:hypothetical protein